MFFTGDPTEVSHRAAARPLPPQIDGQLRRFMGGCWRGGFDARQFWGHGVDKSSWCLFFDHYWLSGAQVPLPVARLPAPRDATHAHFGEQTPLSPSTKAILTRPIMRVTLLLVVLGVFCGCSARQQPSVAPTPKPQAAQPDSIDLLVARLASSHGFWINGLSLTLSLPATASTEEVLARVFQMTGFDKGHVSTHRVLETRQVRIPDSFPDAAYTAVLVETDFGRKIVLLRYESPTLGWWSRVYDG